MSAAETPAADKIGPIPSKYDTAALPVRREAALSRGLMIVAVVEAFAIAGMGFALAAITPLQKVVPMVITSNKLGDQVIRLNPATLESPTADYVTEIQLRNYVKSRYSIDASPAQQQTNVELVQLMSDDTVMQGYVQKAKAEYTRMRGVGLARSVRIDSVRRLPDSDSWQVEYVTSDQSDQPPMAGSQPAEQHSWISTYQVAFKPKNVKYEDRLNNPFGMTITAASDARRD